MSELVALLPLAGLLLAGVAAAAPGLWWLDRRTQRQPTVDVGLTLVHEQMRPVRRRPRRYRGKRRMVAEAVPPRPAMVGAASLVDLGGYTTPAGWWPQSDAAAWQADREAMAGDWLAAVGRRDTVECSTYPEPTARGVARVGQVRHG